MAGQTSAITYDIIARDRASKTMKQVGDNAGKTSQKISSGFGFISKLAVGAVAGVGALGAAGAVMGIKTAAALEQAQIGFTTLLGSSKKAGAYVKDLQKFAANTPFEFQGLVDSSRLLLGVGTSAKDVIPTLTDFGDAAGALGIQQDAFQRIMLATSQAISAGKFQVGDINQLVTNGIPAWTLLSKATGKPVPELRKMASQGKLLSKDVLPALRKEMHKEYGGSMAKQSQTLAGLWSTFTDTLSQGLASAIMPLVPVLKSILPGAMAILGGALKGVATGFAWVMNAVQTFVAGFQNNTDKLVDMNVKWTNPVVNAGFKVREAFDNMLPTIKALVGWVRNNLIPTIVDTAKSVFPSLKAAVKSIGDTIKSNMPTIKSIADIFTGVVIPALGLVVKVALPAVSTAFKVFVWNLKTFILPLVKGTIGAIVLVIGWILTAAAKAFGWVPGIGPKLKSAKKEFDKFAAGVKAALSGIPSHKEINIIAKANLDFTQTGNSNKRAAADHRASGGPVNRGTAYLVGEEGPELFVPGQSGGIIPNSGGRKNAGSSSGSQDFTASTPLVLNVEGREIYRGLLTYMRKSGKTSLALG